VVHDLLGSNPFDWFELEDTFNQILAIFNDVLVVGQCKLVLLNSFVSFLNAFGFERGFPKGKLIDDNAKRPNVCRIGVADVSLNYFGGYVVWSAADCFAEFVIRLESYSQPKVN
jgi:hypothetical protein